MKMSLSSEELKHYVVAQCQHFFPDGQLYYQGKNIDLGFDLALDRVEECFSHISLRSFKRDGETYFSHLHSDQYSQYLYLLANSIWKTSQNASFCDHLLCLNRCLSGLFVSYKCELPPHFLFGHPMGTVIGNADYGDCLVVFQNVTINTGDDGGGALLPKIGKGLFCGTGAKVMGTNPIGDRVSIGVDAVVFNQDIPDDSTVINKSGETVIRPRMHSQCFAQKYFDIDLAG